MATVWRMRLGLIFAVVCGIVFTTWRIDVFRFRKDVVESEATWKTNARIGGQNLDDEVLANWQLADELRLANKSQEHILPFDEADGDEEGGEFETERDRGKRKNASHPMIKTFFTSMKTSFKDVQIGADKSIPSLKFLDACLCTVQLFINMNRRMLDRVVADIRGNVEKIRNNYAAYPDESSTLQLMVQRDVELLREDRYYYSISSILALKWLTRTFQFISSFLTHIDNGEDQSQSASDAYAETLQKHHGIVVRALFKAAFMTMSTRREFLKELAVDETDIDLPRFEEAAMNDLREYNTALKERLIIIEQLVIDNDIET